MGNNSR